MGAEGLRARNTAAAAAAPAAVPTPTKPTLAPTAPTSRERAIVGLFASVALGCVAMVAVGGSGGNTSELSLAAVAIFIVGPVAYGGLVFSFRQLASFFTSVKRSQDLVAAGEAADALLAKPKDLKAAPIQQEAKATEAVGQPAKAQAEAASAKEHELGAWDMIVEAWESLPSAAGLPAKASAFAAAAPEAIGRMPESLASLYTWLTRSRWKPFPWAYLPDPVAFVWGVAEILFIAPLLGIEIAVTVPVMELVKAEWGRKRFARLREVLPELVRSFSRPLGRLTMRDPRNHSYLQWMFLGGIVTPIFFFWALRRHMLYGFEFSTLVMYHLIRVGPRLQTFAHIHTLTHKEGHCHRGFFRGPFQIFNCFTEWWVGPFYGVVPWNYYIAHMKIHHRWHNDVDDVHTNLDLDRTNPLSFFVYVPRFTLYWTGVTPLVLFIKRGEGALIGKLLSGMIAYYGIAALLLWQYPFFCMVYWLFPHMEACVLLCAISYLWHAFVEESDPGNQYVNSVTILEGHDNVWNEDYHVVHHHAPNVHWTEMPAHFEKNKEHYAACTATIFRDTEEGMLLRWLFEGNFDAMAEHFVDLNGKLTKEEKKALIVRRLSVICGEKGRDGKRVGWADTATIRDFEG